MTNSPIDQPMSNAELRALVASNAVAISALGQKIDTGFDRIQQQIDSNAKSIEALTNKESSTAARCKQVDDVVADHVFDRLERIENSLRLLASFAFRHEVKFVEIEERLSELEGGAA